MWDKITGKSMVCIWLRMDKNTYTQTFGVSSNIFLNWVRLFSANNLVWSRNIFSRSPIFIIFSDNSHLWSCLSCLLLSFQEANGFLTKSTKSALKCSCASVLRSWSLSLSHSFSWADRLNCTSLSRSLRLAAIRSCLSS